MEDGQDDSGMVQSISYGPLGPCSLEENVYTVFLFLDVHPLYGPYGLGAIGAMKAYMFA